MAAPKLKPVEAGDGSYGGNVLEAYDRLELVAEFTKCLGTMSHSRAGWDYQLPPAQRAEENRQEQEALSRARKIWSENPDYHQALRDAFAAFKPLATMNEIERAA